MGTSLTRVWLSNIFRNGFTILFSVIGHRILSENAPIMVDSRLRCAVLFMGRGTITIKKAQIGYSRSSNWLFPVGLIEARLQSSSITIEEGTIINNGFEIISEAASIRIGKDCRIGPGFRVYDSDFHGLEVSQRNTQTHKSVAVSIGDGVFIGAGVTVLKGARIPRGSTIGAGSVVTGVFEQAGIYAGNPATLIRRI